MLGYVRFIIFILFFVFSNILHSEESFDKLWGLITYTGNYHSLFYIVEPQIRLINQKGVYEQFLLNTGGGINIASHLQLWMGQTNANFSSYNNVDEDVASNDLNEYRLWQQLLWTIPQTSVILKARLEERYSFENAPWAIRFRERSYWTKQLTENYFFVLSDELFINFKSVPWVVTKTLDQNRAFIGILKQLTPTTSMSISYMNQAIFRIPAEDNHVLVLNFFINMAT